MKRLIAFLACVSLILATTGIQSAKADVSTPPSQRPVGVSTVTFYNPGVLSAMGTVTSYTGITYGGVAAATDMSNVDGWSTADVFVTAGISGTGFMTVTPQFSNDWVNWRSAQFTSFATTVVSQAPIVWSLSTTSTVGYPIPVQGDFLRFKIDVTNITSTQVIPLVRVTFKNYGTNQ